jgi:hypothetical protein
MRRSRRVDPPVDGRFTGFGVGRGVGIGAPLAREHEDLADDEDRIGEAVEVADVGRVDLEPGAEASRVSPSTTVRTSPLTGGMRRTWPMWRSSFDLSLFAHHRVIIETSKWCAISTRVSPDLTL